METQATNEQVGQSFYLDVSSQIDNLKLMTVVKVAAVAVTAVIRINYMDSGPLFLFNCAFRGNFFIIGYKSEEHRICTMQMRSQF